MGISKTILLIILCFVSVGTNAAQIYFRGGELYFEKDTIHPGQLIIRVNTRAGWLPVPSNDSLTIKVNGQVYGVFSDSSRQINGALYDKYYSLAVADSLTGTDSLLRVQVFGREREDHMVNMAFGNSSNLTFYLEGEINLAGVKTLNTYHSPYFNNSIEQRGFINHPLTICDSVISTAKDSTVFTLEALKMDSGVEVPLFQMPDDYDQVHVSHLLLDSTTGYLVWDSPQRVGYYGLHVSTRFYRNGNYAGFCGRDMFLVIDMDTVSSVVSAPKDNLKVMVQGNQLVIEWPYPGACSIYNLMGELVLEGNVKGVNQFDISALRADMYLVVLENRENRVVRKFVKQ